MFLYYCVCIYVYIFSGFRKIFSIRNCIRMFFWNYPFEYKLEFSPNSLPPLVALKNFITCKRLLTLSKAPNFGRGASLSCYPPRSFLKWPPLSVENAQIHTSAASWKEAGTQLWKLWTVIFHCLPPPTSPVPSVFSVSGMFSLWAAQPWVKRYDGKLPRGESW